MFSNLRKASYVVPPWTYMGLLAMHRPIRFTCSIKHLFQNIFSRPVYMHENCIIQGFVDVKQRFTLQSATCTLMYNSEIFLQ